MGIEENVERIANSLEHIAIALEGLNAIQHDNTTINAWYKEHLAGKKFVPPKKAEQALNEAKVEVPVASADPLASGGIVLPTEPTAPVVPEEPVASEGPTQEMILAAAHVSAEPTALTALGRDLTFDILKQELLARGYAYKKGTKATTLQKEWDLHKHEPIIGAKPTPSPLEEPHDVNPVGYAPSLTAAPAPAPAPAPVVQPAPVQPAPTPGPFDIPAAKAPMTKDEAFARIMETFQKPEGKPQAECDFDVDCMKKALAKVGVAYFKQVPEGQFEIVVAEYERLKGITHA